MGRGGSPFRSSQECLEDPGDTVDPDYGMVCEELSAGTLVVVRRCRGSCLESPTRGWVCDRTMMSLPLEGARKPSGVGWYSLDRLRRMAWLGPDRYHLQARRVLDDSTRARDSLTLQDRADAGAARHAGTSPQEGDTGGGGRGTGVAGPRVVFKISHVKHQRTPVMRDPELRGSRDGGGLHREEASQ